MYANTGYLNQVDIDMEDLNKPLIVESCGVYRLIHMPSMVTIRPCGRQDYQLLYVAAGRAFFTFNEKEQEVTAGNMVLYRPGVPQQYSYYLKDSPEIYWIHFTGSEAETVLASHGFSDGISCLRTGTDAEYQQLFLKIIWELQIQRPCFEDLLPLLFRHLLLIVKRHQIEAVSGTSRIKKEVRHAVQYFNENFPAQINIEDYAKSQNMSVCWFIRSFRQYTGMTPMQYITSVRISKAKDLLENTDYNIGEIASVVGYENPLYFSRIFTKTAGCSPSLYRKNITTRP